MGMNILEARRRVMMEQPHIETLVGNPVSFKAEALPLQELKVAINPVQDLHGQDAPYPPGGGKNQFYCDSNKTATLNGVTCSFDASTQEFTISGTNESSSAYVLFNIEPTSEIPRNVALSSAFIGIPNGVYMNFVYYDGNWKSIGQGGTLPDSVSLSNVRIQVGVYGTAGNIPTTKFKCQIEQGSTAPTAWTPYSNICPIIGHTGVNVSRTGVNLLDCTATGAEPDFYYHVINATITPNKITYQSTGTWAVIRLYRKLLPGTYTVSADNSASDSGYVSCQIYKGNTPISENVPATFTLTEETVINFRFVGSNATAAERTVEFNNIQLEKASTASPYAPYAGTTYPITWETAAGTVFGGTLDVVNGVLTVDRVSETITKDSIWYSFNTGTGNSSAVVQLTDYLNVYYNDGSSSRNGSVSSTGKEAQNYWINARQNEVPDDGDMCFAYTSTGQLRFHRTDVTTITDITTFKSSFPDTQIVYKLATPVTYQLSAQQISSLLGKNCLWNDINGDNTVSFYTH